MEKSRFIFAILIVSLLFTISFVFAADENDGFKCLRDKIDAAKCEKLSAEEKALSYLAVSRCKDEILSDSLNDECWPKSDCNVKSTAQSIIALNKANSNTDDAVDWLLTQTSTPKELEWYLQIESSEPTTCKITYDEKEYTIDIDERKINSNAGSCLTLAQGGYWFEVKSGCYDSKFKIVCDESFSTSLIYKKKASSEFYIPEETNSASAKGTTTEKLNSLCFKDGTLCDYESTLWAALALQSSGKEISAFMPYLISMANENSKYLPESFLYKLTENEGFKEQLNLNQNTKGYWDESGNKFYDTAVALYSLQSETETTSQEKSNALSWLLEVQDDDGCWGGITDTAFLLHAGWQKGASVIVESGCEKEGYYCMLESECEGKVLDYDCDSSKDICCDEQKTLETCKELDGKICDSDEECDKSEVDSSDGKCCLGTCEKKSEPSPEPDEKTNYLPWIIILSILIILTVVGIIFRDKLRVYWFMIKSKFSKGRASSFSSEGGPSPPGFLPPGTPQQQDIRPRRILHPQARTSHAPKRPKPHHDQEFSDVLKKLKEMGS